MTDRRGCRAQRPVGTLSDRMRELLALPFAFFDALALVGFVLAFGEADFHFGDAAFVEIDAKWNEGHALALDRTQQLVHLTLVQKQTPRAMRLMLQMLMQEVQKKLEFVLQHLGQGQQI